MKLNSPTPVTHPFAVDIIEMRDCSRSGGARRAYIGLQLFDTMAAAQAYADECTSEGGVECVVRKARKGDREFA